MNDDSTAALARTWTRVEARRHREAQRNHGMTPVPPDCWIVRVPDRDPAPVAAGPTAGEALCLARELGHGEGGQAEQATADDLDSLDLPPSALGIPSGAAPWWREADPNPLVPDRIDLDPRRPAYYLYHAVEGRDSPIGATVHAWGEVEADELRRYFGTGRLVGWLRRERAYSQDIAYFKIGDYWHRATDRDDVALAVVEGPDGRYLPSYPRCPDCGGAVEWAEAFCEFAPVQSFDWPYHGPGSRECTGCGSRFSDTQYSRDDLTWRKADPDPLDPRRPVYYRYRTVKAPDSPIGATAYAWGEVEADGLRRYLGTGRLVGWLRRERIYQQDAQLYDRNALVTLEKGIAYFRIAYQWHEATDRDDVALAVVWRPGGGYLRYPSCPDCGGMVGVTTWGRRGSRECAGCGSRFSDTQHSGDDA